jgi:cold shock CspA family protein
MIGEVVEFDDEAGYGTVQAEGGTRHFFHCTAVADGSRSIEVGTAVRFEVVPGRRGQWEGTALEPVSRPR